MRFRYLARGVAVALLAVLSACWHFDDSDNGSDAPPDAGIAANRVEIAGFAPADGAQHVGVFSEFRIQLAREIVPEALQTVRVSLQEQECDTEWECTEVYFDHASGRPYFCGFCHSLRGSEWLTDADISKALYRRFYPDVPGQLTYDATVRAIVFKPARPLNHGAKYRLVVDGLRDAAGAAMPPQAITVDTARNLSATSTSRVNGRVYSQSSWTYDTARRLRRYTYLTDTLSDSYGYDYDDQGRLIRQTTYGGGPDNQLGNDDDVVARYFYLLRNSTGDVEWVHEYWDVGMDTTWFTGDDELHSYIVTPVDAAGHVRFRADVADAGPDALWLTADDVPYTPYFMFRYDTGHHTRKTIPVTGAGNDGLWLTDDDLAGAYWSDTFDAQGRIELSQAWSAGADQVWLSDDDVATGYRKVRVEQTTEDLRVISYGAAPGADSAPFTDDDVVSDYVMRTYDLSGKRRRFVAAANPGADAVWFTADDVPAYYATFDYDARGLLARVVEFTAAGPDQVWNTSDDMVGQYHRYSYDADGNMVRTLDFDRPGPDDSWFTDDDQVYRDTGYQADR